MREKKRLFPVLKKSAALILAVGTVLTAAVWSVAEDEACAFQDVNAEDWFYDDVTKVYEIGLMNGVSADSFSPDEPLSRAMSVTVMYRMAGSPDVSELENSFNDVPEGKWYTDAVTWAYNADVVKGRSDALFDPDDFVTRAELSAMLLRYADSEMLKLPDSREYVAFSDQAEIPEYAETAVKLLNCSGIINGMPGNSFDPSGNTTRAQAAAMFNRFNSNTEGSDTELLEKYGLGMSVSVWKDSMPTTSPDSGQKNHFAVSFTKSDTTTSELPDMSVSAKIANSDAILEKLSELKFSITDADAVTLDLKEGQIIPCEITVTIDAQVGVYYCYPSVEVVY